MKFSANLGFLWNELSLPDAIDAAAKAGFDAVECHWPYETPASEVMAALERNELPLMCLNTSRGDVGAAENGLSALPGREEDAKAAIDEALAYAAATKAESIHVMAGYASGELAEETFLGNLRYACARAAEQGTTVLIEPLNRYDAPGYFLKTAPQAVKIIERVGAENLQMLFDFYHIQIMEGNLTNNLRDHVGHVGHLQCASVPRPGGAGSRRGRLRPHLRRGAQGRLDQADRGRIQAARAHRGDAGLACRHPRGARQQALSAPARRGAGIRALARRAGSGREDTP